MSDPLAPNATVADPSALLAAVDFNGTIGVGYLGVVFSTLIYGITCIQSIQYFRSSKASTDPFYIYLFVICMWLLDSVHQALVIHSHYITLVSGWGNPTQLETLVWSIPASIMVGSVIFILIRCFFLKRIWTLSRNVWVTIALGLLAIARFILAIYFASRLASKTLVLEAEAEAKTIGIYALSFEVATNVMYPAVLVWYLVKSRSGIPKSDSIVSRIITLIVGTSMLCAFVAIADLISYVVAPTKLYNLFFEFILETLDTNAALTSLNSRTYLATPRGMSGVDSTFNSIPLASFQGTTTVNSPEAVGYAEKQPDPRVLHIQVEKASYVA